MRLKISTVLLLTCAEWFGKIEMYLSNVSYGWVTGEVRTFLKEGSDTSKNFCIGVLAKFRVILVPENLRGDSPAAQGFQREKKNEFFFSLCNPWAMVFPSFTRGIPKMTTLGSTWHRQKALGIYMARAAKRQEKFFAELFFKKATSPRRSAPL